MNTTIRHTPLIAALVIGLSACQTPGGMAELSDAEQGKPKLGERLSKLLDEQCPIPIKEKDDLRVHRQLRLIRAEWFLAVATRFGAARIPDYSPDAATDAAILLNQITKTMRLLREAENEVKQDPTLYELARTDLVMAILRTGYFAIEPAVQGVRNDIVSFIARPDAERSLQAAKRLFEDKLYADAYKLTCTEHMNWVVQRRDAAQDEARRQAAMEEALTKAKGRVEEHFLAQCNRVAELSGVGKECRWPTT